MGFLNIVTTRFFLLSITTLYVCPFLCQSHTLLNCFAPFSVPLFFFFISLSPSSLEQPSAGHCPADGCSIDTRVTPLPHPYPHTPGKPCSPVGAAPHQNTQECFCSNEWLLLKLPWNAHKDCGDCHIPSRKQASH